MQAVNLSWSILQASSSSENVVVIEIWYLGLLIYVVCVCPVDRRDVWDILLDIRRLRGGGGERREREYNFSGDIDSVGAGGDGHGLLRRTYLRRTFQPRRHHCFRFLQEIPLETGDIIIHFRLQFHVNSHTL